MWNGQRSQFLLFLSWAACVGLVALPGAVRAQEPASVIIVFDGSGSMAGTIEGGRASKVAMARDAVRRALPAINPRTRVGLLTFGHRRGDCGDIELLRPLEPLDAQRLGDSVDRVNPRGRGPVANALREAAKAFDAQPGKRAIVLIHDDNDNCQQNVCQAAEELRRAGITAHVVGLGLKPMDAAAMACVPQITGGRILNVRTPEQINVGVEEMLRVAESEAPQFQRQPAAAVARPGPQADAVPRAAPPIPADGPVGIYMRALLTAGAEPLGSPLHWTVAAEGKPDSVLFAGRAANPYLAVAPGRYVVEARDGPVVSSLAVEVGDKGPTPALVVLNAGTLAIKAQAQKTAAPLGDAIVTVRDAGQGGDAAGPPVAVFKGGEGQLLLPAGRYLVRVEQGAVRGERSVVVPAGSQGRLEVPLNAARVLLTATGSESGPSSEPLVFSVVEDDPDAPKGRREVARSAARQADFVLPPGTYHVVARQGRVEARERLAVGPGDVVRRSLNLVAGRLALTTKPAANVAVEPVSYRVERLDGPVPEVVTTSRASPTLVLPGGRYRVEGRYGAMNVRVTRDVEVKAGQTQQVMLEPQAASLKLRLVSGGTPVGGDVLWDIRDESGAAVWTTGQPEPGAMLQAGRYTVRAETRDKRYDRAIELRAGESRVLEMTAD